jgi:hypothetical protein
MQYVRVEFTVGGRTRRRKRDCRGDAKRRIRGREWVCFEHRGEFLAVGVARRCTVESERAMLLFSIKTLIST